MNARSAFKIIWYFFKDYKMQGFFVLGLIAATGFLDALNLAALYPVMHNGLSLEAEQGSQLLRVLYSVSQSFGDYNPLTAACLFLIVISIVAIIGKIIYSYVSYRFMMVLERSAKASIIEKLTQADYDFYVRNKQGKLIHTATVAPDYVSNIVLSTLRLIFNGVSALFLFSLLLLLSWQATTLLIVISVIYSLFVKKVMKQIIFKCANIATNANRIKNVVLNELITGIKPIRVFCVAQKWKERYLKQVDIHLINKFKMLMGRIYPEVSMKFMFFLVIALVGLYLSRLPSSEIISILPVFGTFAIVASRIFPAIQLVGNTFIGITDCLPNTKIVYDLCNEDVQKIADGTQEFQHFKESIEIKDIWFQYPQGHEEVLKGVSFKIPKNQMTAIAGGSGSGKTTLVSLLLKLYQQQKGTITIDGVDIFNLTNQSYLSRIGYVGQETFIFNTSIRENINFGMDNCTDEMIEHAAKQAHAHEFIIQTKEGYDTVVGDSGIKLSGGQKQRLAIARALLRKPEIIFLDEATSSLDNISERKVQEAVIQISKHTTMVVIAHRLSTIQNADNIILLENGEVKEQGTHEDLLKNQDLYYKFHSAINDSADKREIVSEVS